MSSSSKTSKPTVLVTGFGLFLDVKTNPSWSIASRLPSDFPNIKIVTPVEPLKAVYQSLLSVPDLIEKVNPDIVLHIGLAFDRDYFAIEKGVERNGYHQFPDEERKVVSRKETKERWGKSPDRLDTSFDVDGVVQNWKSNFRSGSKKVKEKGRKGKDWELKASDDVGTYVCGFVYYASLEYFWTKNGAQGKRNVVFLHVPPLEEDEIEKGVDIVVALIKALVESL